MARSRSSIVVGQSRPGRLLVRQFVHPWCSSMHNRTVLERSVAQSVERGETIGVSSTTVASMFGVELARPTTRGSPTPSTGAAAARSPPPPSDSPQAPRHGGSTTPTPRTRPGPPRHRRWANSTRTYACRAYLNGARRLALPTDARAAARRRVPPAAGADGLADRRRAGAGADPRVLRRPRRASLPVDAVRAPPLGAAVHAGARHHPRAHRPRQRARRSAVRRTVRSRRRGRSRGARRRAELTRFSGRSGSRSSSAWSARTAS